ncbi:MAG: 4Fe-4S dicluster domain-containing protein [Armatimonadetes bacterium]|nr:4Fe-4S dicluster domain-containing protein [Armatimonadota bacterium]
MARPATNTLDAREVATVDHEACLRCGRCVEVCPTAAISMTSEETPRVKAELCRGCGACTRVCPVGAISLQPVQAA